MSLDQFKDEVEKAFSNIGTIDIIRKKKITVRIIDSDGDEVDFKEMIDNLNRYITDNMEAEEANLLRDQYAPLTTQLFMSGILYAAGDPRSAAFIASQPDMRVVFTHLMLLSTYFIKLIQKNELQVVTEEIDISDEEIDKINRVNYANQLTAMGSMMGANPREMIKAMIKEGYLQKSDLSQALAEELDNVQEDSETQDNKNKPDPTSN
jgi:hypothetical protein